VLFWFGKKHDKHFLQMADFVAPIIPLGLGAGRIGNFINAELWGRTADVPWAIVFPGAGPLPRHPSQLYEFLLEGLVLFAMLWLYSQKKRPTGSIGALFCIGYGSFRFFIEYFRQPDEHLLEVSQIITRGQMLSLPMILVGIAVLVWVYRKEAKAGVTQ
jgi:phosphatidylglycerol:prolipoprotein diacylglycerol transferase